MKKRLIILLITFLCSCNTISEKQIKEHEMLYKKIEVLDDELSSQKNKMEELKVQINYLKQDLKKVEPNKELDELFLQVRNSVYFIRTIDENQETSLGSAFCITDDGIVISNHHVFKNASESFAYNKNGNKFLISEIIEENDSLDYIIFRLGPLTRRVSFIPISFNTSNIGENVFTVGNPKGREQTLSNGIISGYREKNRLIQTTTEITNGSSGGPLFNKKGEVIGITTSGYGEANLNFAININDLDLYKYIKPKKIVYDSVLTHNQLLQKMNNYYNDLRLENINLVENHYNDTLKRYHRLFSIKKNIAVVDHRNYLSKYKIIKNNIIAPSLEIFKSNNEYTLQYKINYQIIRKKDNSPLNYILKSVAVINNEGRINSIYDNILTKFKN